MKRFLLLCASFLLMLAGNARSLERPSVGPFENIRPGRNEFVIWKF